MDRIRPGRLGAEETESVLRRAAELDRRHAPPGEPLVRNESRLDAGELERIAAESGLSPEAVRRALTELDGGALDPGLEPARRAGNALADLAVAQRTLGGAPGAVEKSLEAKLRRYGLAPVSRQPHGTSWEPAPGLGNAVSRAINFNGSSIFAGATLESSVYAISGERTAIDLRGKVSNLRAPVAAMMALLLAFPAGVALLAVLAFGLRWGFTAEQGFGYLLIAACWAGLSWLVSRGVARKRVRKLQRALERILATLG